jgi:hypothetical protein
VRRSLLLLPLLAGCAFFRSPPVQDTLKDIHELRLNVEGIPGVVPLVNAYAPWAPAARLGLNGLYDLDVLAVSVASMTSTARALTSTAH